MGMAYADFALANSSQYRFMFMTPLKHSHVDGAGNPIMPPDEGAYRFLLNTVAEGIEAGRYRPEISDPHELAQMMWGGIHGVISLWLNHSEDQKIEWRAPRETVRSLVDVTIRGALRNPAS